MLSMLNTSGAPVGNGKYEYDLPEATVSPDFQSCKPG